MLLGLSEVRALKIDHVATITPKICAWITSFYDACGKYPEDMNELVNKNPHPEWYDSESIYKHYIDSGFEIIYNKDLLILIVRYEKYEKKPCICDVKGRKYHYYDENNRLTSIKYAP